MNTITRWVKVTEQAGEYGKARCRVRELERKLEEARVALRKIAAHVGAGVGEQCSHQFHLLVEEEVRLVVARLRDDRDRAEARVAELERELSLAAQRNAALLSDKDAVDAVLRTDSSLAELRGRVKELEGRLQNVVAEWRDRSANMPTNRYYNASADLSESETLGGCADEIDAVLSKREGWR